MFLRRRLRTASFGTVHVESILPLVDVMMNRRNREPSVVYNIPWLEVFKVRFDVLESWA